MHYKGGTEAKLGDTVRGYGYNLKHQVQGVVVGLNPGQDTCNLHLVYVRPHQPLGAESVGVVPMLAEEHGSAAEFELVVCSPMHPGRLVAA